MNVGSCFFSHNFRSKLQLCSTLHDTFLTRRGRRGFIVHVSSFFFAMVSNVGDTMWFQPSAPNVKVVRISNTRR